MQPHRHRWLDARLRHYDYEAAARKQPKKNCTKFVVFRLTDDECAKCHKPRAEHPKA